MLKQATKSLDNGVTTASILKSEIPGMYRVTVIHRFDNSPNFCTVADMDKLSLVAAEGLIVHYTK